MHITSAMVKAAEIEVSRCVGENEIDRLDRKYRTKTVADLEEFLEDATEEFNRNGGRGVELADRIDGYRILIAARKQDLQDDPVPDGLDEHGRDSDGTQKGYW